MYETVSEDLRRMRVESELTQEQVGDMLHLSASTIRNYEMGIVPPSPMRVRSLITFYKKELANQTDLNNDFSAVPQRLRKMRRLADMTLKEVGEALFVTDVAIHNYESGKRPVPFDMLEKMAHLYGYEPSLRFFTKSD